MSSSDNDAPKGSATRQVVRGSIWLGLSRLLGIVFTVASTAILARLLAPETFGVVAAVFAILGLPVAIYEGSFGLSLVQRARLGDDDVRVAFWIALALAGALSSAMLALAPLAETLMQFEGLAALLVGASAMLPLRAALSISNALLQRHGRFATLASIGVISTLVSQLLVATPLAMLGYGAWSIVIGALAGAIVELAIAYGYVRHPLALPRSWTGAGETGKVSGLFALTQILNWAALSAPNFVVGRQLGAASLGLYSRGWRLMEIVLGATASPLQRTLIPAFSRLQDEIPRARAALERAVAISTAVFAIFSAGFIVHAEAIIRILLGEGWLAAVAPAQILFAALVPRAAYKLTEAVGLGFGRAGWTAMLQGAFLVLMGVGAFIGAQYGATGAALGVAGAIWMIYAISLTRTHSLLQASPGKALMAHLRAAGLAGVLVAADLAAARLAAPSGFWAAQFFGALAGGCSLLAVLALAPQRVLGGDLHWLRSQARGLVDRRLRRRKADGAS